MLLWAPYSGRDWLPSHWMEGMESEQSLASEQQSLNPSNILALALKRRILTAHTIHLKPRNAACHADSAFEAELVST